VKKTVFLTKVAETMKEMISHEQMMASIQRSCMRAEAENLALMGAEEEDVDRLISGIVQPGRLEIPDKVLDVLVLRYLKNTQFLVSVKEEAIDVSGLSDALSYWKKTMLFRAP
jgi:hypothetical protein